MNDGAGGTLELHPHGGTTVAFTLNGAMPSGGDGYKLIVDLGRLRLGETDRVQWDYEDGNEGGRATSRKLNLVEVVFPVVIKAASVTGRIAGYNALLRGVTNRRGGTLEYAPENPAGSTSTFFHYQASAAPVLLESPRNRWDSAPGSDGLYTLEVDVELQTQPFATSDPDSLVKLFASEEGYELIDSRRVKASDAFPIINLAGTEPVLTRILAWGNSSQDVGRVIVFRKSGVGKDADIVIDSADLTKLGVTQYWSTDDDVTALGGSYLRLNPPEDANGQEYGVSFALADPTHWEGVFAVFAIGYDESGVGGAWTHHVKLRMGDVVVQESEEYYARDFQNWQFVYGGELELPPTTLSEAEKTAGYGETVYIDWYSKRNVGLGGFRVDGIVLVQIRDAEGEVTVLDVLCEGEEAVTGDTERLLIENVTADDGRPLEVAHVLTSDEEFKRALSVAPRGEFLALDPAQEHTLRFLEEKKVLPPFVDDIVGYSATYWGQLGHFEPETPRPALCLVRGLGAGVRGDLLHVRPRRRFALRGQLLRHPEGHDQRLVCRLRPGGA